MLCRALEPGSAPRTRGPAAAAGLGALRTPRPRVGPFSGLGTLGGADRSRTRHGSVRCEFGEPASRRNPFRPGVTPGQSGTATPASATVEAFPPQHRPGAVNLHHYLELRSHDVRHLQQGLADLGLSSLGRAEAHVHASLRSVRCALRKLAGVAPDERPLVGPDFVDGRAALDRNAEALLGPSAPGRSVRMMVTADTALADDPRRLQQCPLLPTPPILALARCRVPGAGRADPRGQRRRRGRRAVRNSKDDSTKVRARKEKRHDRH